MLPYVPQYLLMCLTIFQGNAKRNFTFKDELLHQSSLWKAEGADMFLSLLPRGTPDR